MAVQVERNEVTSVNQAGIIAKYTVLRLEGRRLSGAGITEKNVGGFRPEIFQRLGFPFPVPFPIPIWNLRTGAGYYADPTPNRRRRS